MKKIAILRCLKKSAACAGVSCINAFYDREKTFEQYGDEEMRLMSVWTCNGCGASMLENQEGINKKIAKMQAIGVDVVHLSNCTRKKMKMVKNIFVLQSKELKRNWKQQALLL